MVQVITAAARRPLMRIDVRRRRAAIAKSPDVSCRCRGKGRAVGATPPTATKPLDALCCCLGRGRSDVTAMAMAEDEPGAGDPVIGRPSGRRGTWPRQPFVAVPRRAPPLEIIEVKTWKLFNFWQSKRGSAQIGEVKSWKLYYFLADKKGTKTFEAWQSIPA